MPCGYRVTFRTIPVPANESYYHAGFGSPMRIPRRSFLALAAAAPLRAAAPQSSLVHPGPGGPLVYEPDPAGNTIPDFSHAGYGGGGVPLPDVPVAAELGPASGDATGRIQQAIDRVSRLPLRDGLRGAVLLRQGEYAIAGTLHISASGVVLRGDRAVLRATGTKQRSLVEVRGPQPVKPSADPRPLLDPYVPVGTRSFRVRSAAGLRPGDTVTVRRAGNAGWIHFIAMDRIKPRPADPNSTKQWAPFTLDFDRVVTAVDGDRITVDAPIACAIEARWGGGEIVPYTESRIARCGVENLRAVSDFDRSVKAAYGREKMVYFSDERHAWTFVSFANAVNVWARGLTAEHFGYACVSAGGGTKWLTVAGCRCLDMVSILTGSRRYPYSISGQLCLVEKCSADTARHDFAVGSRVCGPNVFLDCTAGTSYATSEPHHRWSVGGLFDNVKADIAFQDRQHYGTGHGWAGANYVAWNCEGSLVCQKPPTAQNWSIGHIGKKLPGAFAPREDGWWESQGHHVEPRSLYRAQLADRLGKKG
jgi:hypothetical protein